MPKATIIMGKDNVIAMRSKNDQVEIHAGQLVLEIDPVNGVQVAKEIFCIAVRIAEDRLKKAEAAT